MLCSHHALRKHITDEVTLHTYALKCEMPGCVASCVAANRTLRSAVPGNDMTLIRISTSASIGECPTSGRKQKRREHDADELALNRDGEEVFVTSGYYSFVAESEPSCSFRDRVGY